MNQKSKADHIIDYISGQEVKATPEEVDAVQVFARQLVEDYHYPKSHVQTRPQFRVSAKPSDTKRQYPVDIAVFSDPRKQEQDIHIIVECKKKNRKDGLTQLKHYLRFSKAYLGVWFNGKARIFLRKFEKNGQLEFENIPNIPQYKQRIEDIGKFKRQDLKPTHNLKIHFRTIRNYLAANNVGATRDEVLARQLINLIFCKIYDEKFTAPQDTVTFRAGIGETPAKVKERILELFEKVKARYHEVLDDNDTITLDAKSVTYVVGELQIYCLTEAQRDVISDAFETFIGHTLKGGQGQFFTPRNVVKMMVDILDPEPDDLILDPACGSGGFLIESLRHVWQKIEGQGKHYNWSQAEINREKQTAAGQKFRGIDKDYFLAKVTKAYMTLIGDGRSGIVCDDSLETVTGWQLPTKQKIGLEQFDILITNPPFGAKIPVQGEEKLKQFELGYKWRCDKETKAWTKSKLKEQEAPQILFIERCLQFLKPGGKMAIVLPEGVFGNPTDRYIWNFLLKQTKIEGIISLPPETFQPNTSFKTSVLILKKELPPSDYQIFMAIPKTCGHNKNGKPIFILDQNNQEISDDEIAAIAPIYQRFKTGNLDVGSHLGFKVDFSEVRNHIFIPTYYDLELKQELDKLKTNFELFSISDLVGKNILKTLRGNEIGSKHYGKGDIPFIRTSDLVNWEIITNPEKCVPQSVYLEYKTRQNIRAADILFVKDGSPLLIGRTAFVTAEDTKIIIQSHLIKLTVLENEILDSYYLLYLLNLPIVQRQVKKNTFVQGTIPTIGSRFGEIILPIHKDQSQIEVISAKIRSIITAKSTLKNEVSNLYDGANSASVLKLSNS